MNWKGLLVSVLGLQASVRSNSTLRVEVIDEEVWPESDARDLAAPYTDVGQGEINSVVSMVNYARSHVKVPAYAMPRVSWDYQLEAALKQAVKDIDTDWWFGSDNQPTARYNSQLLLRYAPFNTSFPGYDFMIHDGCRNAANALQIIFRMRAINQARFFKYNLCSDTIQPNNWGYINSYFSCAGINRTVTPLVSGEPWSWMWQYYPKIVNDDMDKFACMLLGSPGPNADGKNHPNHFFCYWGKKSHAQTSEKPYVAVEPGQKAGDGCPGKVVKKLCI